MPSLRLLHEALHFGHETHCGYLDSICMHMHICEAQHPTPTRFTYVHLIFVLCHFELTTPNSQTFLVRDRLEGANDAVNIMHRFPLSPVRHRTQA